MLTTILNGVAPADSPWVNGATEVLVKTVKRSLNAAVGEQVLSFVELQTVMTETVMKHRFDHIQNIVQMFWKKWPSDVFPGLVIRPKWHVESSNVQKGDVVLIQDSNAVRGKWKLGIVSEIFPEKDDRVRRVNVVYKNLPAQEKLPSKEPSKD